MASSNVIVTGHKEVDATFASLPYRIQSKIARRSLRKGTKLIAKKAKVNVKRMQDKDAEAREDQTGLLIRGIKVKAGKRSRSGISMSVTTTERFGYRGEGYGGAQFEFGFLNRRPRPFLRDAGYTSEYEVRDYVIADILSELKKV